MESLDEREADDLLIENIRRYADKFPGGTKSWKGWGLQYWRESLMHTVEAAVRRKLSEVKPQLITIVLRYEPANVKLRCLKALVVFASDGELWPVVLQLLNDRFSQVRDFSERVLLKMEQYHHRTVEKITESFDQGTEQKWPFLSNLNKQVVLTKIELLRKLQDPAAAESLDNIASRAKDAEVADLASQVAVVLRRSAENTPSST